MVLLNTTLLPFFTLYPHHRFHDRDFLSIVYFWRFISLDDLVAAMWELIYVCGNWYVFDSLLGTGY